MTRFLYESIFPTGQRNRFLRVLHLLYGGFRHALIHSDAERPLGKCRRNATLETNLRARHFVEKANNMIHKFPLLSNLESRKEG